MPNTVSMELCNVATRSINRFRTPIAQNMSACLLSTMILPMTTGPMMTVSPSWNSAWMR